MRCRPFRKNSSREETTQITARPMPIAPFDPVADGVAATLLAIPDTSDAVPDARLIAHIYNNRARYERPLRHYLRATIATTDDIAAGRRIGTLISILGEWRAPEAARTIVQHIDAAQPWADDELIHALTRIGPRALTPLLFVLFERDRHARARQRAVRALASIALAACDYGDEPDWDGDPDSHYREVTSALRLIVSRRRTESRLLVREAALRLCELRCSAALDDIITALAEGAIRSDATFNAAIAQELCAGHRVSFELGGYRISMLDWLLRA